MQFTSSFRAAGEYTLCLRVRPSLSGRSLSPHCNKRQLHQKTMDLDAETVQEEEFDVDGFLQFSTPTQHDQRILTLFKMLDKDNSGSIDKAEFQKYYDSLRTPTQMALELHFDEEDLSREIMLQADSDGNNVVDLVEFKNFVAAKERELFSLWHKLDTSRDGKVDSQELSQALLGSDISTSERNKFIQSVLKGRRELKWDEFLDAFLLNPRESDELTSAYGYYKDAFRGMGYSVFGTDTILLPPEAARAEELQSRVIVAYAVASALSRTITAPLDRLRVFFQLGGSSNIRRNKHRAAAKKDLLPPKGLAVLSSDGRLYMKRIVKRALKQISTDGGLYRGLWKGNGINVVKLIPESFVRVIAMGLARVYIAHKEDAEDLISISNKGLFQATALSGLASQLVVQPLDTIRTQMMSGIERLSEDTGVDALKDKDKVLKKIPKPDKPALHPLNPHRADKAHLRSFSTAIHGKDSGHAAARLDVQKSGYSALGVTKHIWKTQGFRGYYRGLLPALACVVPFTAFNDGVYEVLENQWFDNHEDEDGYIPPTIPRVLGMGLVSVTTAQIAIYPLSVIQSRMMAQGTPLHPYHYNNTWDCVMQTYTRNGVAGFWRGVSFSLMKSIPTVGLLFGLFEYGKRHWFDLTWNPSLGIWENETGQGRGRSRK